MQHLSIPAESAFPCAVSGRNQRFGPEDQLGERKLPHQSGQSFGQGCSTVDRRRYLNESVICFVTHANNGASHCKPTITKPQTQCINQLQQGKLILLLMDTYIPKIMWEPTFAKTYSI